MAGGAYLLLAARILRIAQIGLYVLDLGYLALDAACLVGVVLIHIVAELPVLRISVLQGKLELYAPGVCLLSPSDSRCMVGHDVCNCLCASDYTFDLFIHSLPLLCVWIYV